MERTICDRKSELRSESGLSDSRRAGKGKSNEEKGSATTQRDRVDLSGAIQAGGAHEDRGSDGWRRGDSHLGQDRIGHRRDQKEEPWDCSMKSSRAEESSKSTPGRTPSPETVVSFTGLRGRLATRRDRIWRSASSMTAANDVPVSWAKRFADFRS